MWKAPSGAFCRFYKQLFSPAGKQFICSRIICGNCNKVFSWNRCRGEKLLEAYRTEKVMEYTEGAEFLTEMDTNLMFKTLDKIKVFEKETESKCKNEEVVRKDADWEL